MKFERKRIRQSADYFRAGRHLSGSGHYGAEQIYQPGPSARRYLYQRRTRQLLFSNRELHCVECGSEYYYESVQPVGRYDLMPPLAQCANIFYQLSVESDISNKNSVGYVAFFMTRWCIFCISYCNLYFCLKFKKVSRKYTIYVINLLVDTKKRHQMHHQYTINASSLDEFVCSIRRGGYHPPAYANNFSAI